MTAADPTKPEVYTLYAIDRYSERGKIVKEVVKVGKIEIQPGTRRLTGHFNSTPTSAWGWKFFGLPFGEPVPDLLPQRPEKQKPPPTESDEPFSFFGDHDEAGSSE
jgi:hypothetical protein